MPVIFNSAKIMVAMSGGVDSTVCASLLKDAGHCVHCVYFVMSEAHVSGIAAAQRSCEELGLPLTVLHLEDSFTINVAEPFCQDYCSGITPNPCVICNPLVKFKALSNYADAEDCAFFATGHYARIEEINGLPILRKSASLERDQSYMLYRLPPEILSRLILPLGDLTKNAVRKYAQEHEISAHNLPDSQEICFVPDGDYPAYIHHHGFVGNAGSFLSPEGEKLAAHRGVEYYTIGQRRGLGVSLGKPVFVQRILPNGDIQLAYSGAEYANAIILRDIILNGAFSVQSGEQYSVKIRSAARPALCTLESVTNDEITARFIEPQRAPAPGQSVVFYQDDLVIGGGIITDFN